MKKERLFYLDFIRAMSIFFIVIFHFYSFLNSISVFSGMILYGYYGYLGSIGVSLFLIISGASLMYVYQDNFSLKNFFSKRFIAIYPMFWTAYAIAFLYLFFMYKAINHSVSKWTSILTIFGMDGYLWSVIPNYYILGEWFLGFIILFYIGFPFLRKLVLSKPKSLIFLVVIIYIVVVEKYSFNFPITQFLFARLPEFLFGMYFIKYIKNIKIYPFLGALSICIIFLFINISHIINILDSYITTIVGVSSFIVFAFIGQHLRSQLLKYPFIFISKYSYAICLVHHVIIIQLANSFIGRTITLFESYCLFIIICVVTIIISVYLYKISNELSRYLQEIHLPKS